MNHAKCFILKGFHFGFMFAFMLICEIKGSVKVSSGTVCTSEIFCQVWMVHQAMAGKLHAFQSNRDVDVIKPKETQMVKIVQLRLAVEMFISLCRERSR